MTTTDNYNLKLAEGNDLVNPLVIDNPNYETIDEVMKENADNGIPSATELTTGTVHALTRSNPDAKVFHFTATSNFATGDTFTVDNVQVTALLPSGLPLATGAYIIGSEVICALRDTLLTVFVSGGTAVLAEDSERLGGELPAYYATQSDMDDAEDGISALGTITNSLDLRVTALEQGGTGVGGTVLWSNPNYASNFAGQEVTLSDDIGNYDYYEVVAQLQAGTGTTAMITFTSGLVPSVRNTQINSLNAARSFIFNGNKCTINNGVYYSTYGGSGTVDNSRIIPISIIGFNN